MKGDEEQAYEWFMKGQKEKSRILEFFKGLTKLRAGAGVRQKFFERKAK